MALLSVFIVSSLVCSAVARMIRGITYYGPNTDDEKEVKAARELGILDWPAKAVRAAGRHVAKVFFIFLLGAMQRLLGDRTSERPLVYLCIASNGVSALLVFLIAETYWGASVGLLAFALFLFCFWPWQLALLGAPICVAQACFLAAVYFVQAAKTGVQTFDLAWYFASGVVIGLALFSSSSSRKYLPLYLGALLYSQLDALSWPVLGSTGGWSYPENFRLTVLFLALTLGLGILLLRLSYKTLLTAICSEGTMLSLRKMSGRRNNDMLARSRAEKVFALVLNVGLGVIFYIIIIYTLPLSRAGSFYLSQFVAFLGICAASLLLTYPDVVTNMRLYYYFGGVFLGTHLDFYKKSFKGIGKPVPENERRGGLRWVVRFFRRVLPFHSLLSIACLLALVLVIIVEERPRADSWEIIGVAILSLSPVLLGEATRSPQFGRTYFPGFVGILLLIAYTIFRLEKLLSPPGQMVFWFAVICAMLVSAGWNVWVFLDDVWPARMAPAWLGRKLEELGIREFYTYDTPYNHAFVDGLRLKVGDRYKVHTIKGLEEVKTGYVVVPGTSAKALNMESELSAIETGDFDLDPVLNRLIQSKLIVNYAVASFKTFGTSRMWVHESDLTTYRDLILREINEHDRWRGRAWILDAGKLHADGLLKLGN